MAKWLSWAIVLVWGAIIFYLSHEPATSSRELSTGMTDTMVTFIERAVPASEIDTGVFHHLLRKSAHFFAYSILGIFVFLALRLSGARGYRLVFIALFLCIVFAISDEVHQLFVPGRSGEIRDVLIDGTGSFVGIGAALIVEKVLSRKRNRCIKKPSFGNMDKFS